MATAFILLIVGLIAILIEFFLPGAVFGTIGGIFLLFSIILFASASESIALTLLYTLLTGGAVALLIKFALWRIRQGPPERSIYSNADQEGYVASSWDKSLVGKKGRVTTDLKPGGHIAIGGKQYSALSQSGYIASGEEVIVAGGEGETLIVKKG